MPATNIFQPNQLPTGRIVWGNVAEPNDKDANGQPRRTKSGQPKVSYDFGVAFAKGAERHWAETPWGQVIWAEGHKMLGNAGQLPHFAWKVTDGDSATPNKRGKVPREQEGYPGHWIVSFSSQFAPQLYDMVGKAAPVLITDPRAIKCGDYVQVSGTCQPNGDANSPGVYVNHGIVVLIAYGQPISSGPNVSAVGFGHQGALPAGASLTPVGGMNTPPAPAPAPAPAAGMPPPPAAAYAPPPAPAAVVPPTPVVPAPQFSAPPPAVPVPPPAPAAAPPARVMTAKAGGTTYEAFRAQGWTDDQMIAQGFMLA